LAEKLVSKGHDLQQGIRMKSIIAASLAVLIGAGSLAAVTAPASAAAVVVRVGPHHHHGHWMWHGRWWGHRAWVCHRWHHHRRVCVWRYW
jgi:hypothetical protein